MVLIYESVLKDLIKHTKEEFPREACGLLLGLMKNRDIIINLSYRARNVSGSQYLYEVDPLDTYRALEEAESLGLELVGVYHSHPFGRPSPSRVDVERAVPGLIYLIVSEDGSFKVFELIVDEFEELEISIR
ncbi:MAG: M67 family metallopeptidase [Candidatus Korarchaeum sp.]|nr:M67 family metallopeptidase [Candidatus Korarchaeum sp.]